MTYNFDTDRWFEIQLAALERKMSRGEITKEEHQAQRKKLVDEYEKMLDRLDIRHEY